MTARHAATSRSECTGEGPRIVVASSGLGHVARGVEAWAADLGAALARRGANVTLCKGGGEAATQYERVIPCWQRGSTRAQRAPRLLPRSLAWRLGVASAYGLEQVTFAWHLIRFLRSWRADVLHVQDPLVALIAQRARQLGLVSTRTILAHGTEEPDSFLSKIDYVQHLTPWHEAECRAHGVSKPGWAAIPNFIDLKRFHPGKHSAIRGQLGIPAEALVVLTAAAIKRNHKRIDALLTEFAGLCAAQPSLPVYLVVAGGHESDTDELVEAGKKLLRDRVRFLVRFPREQMAELYRSADLFVLASLKEMMPIALLEAMASGLACIVNRHPVLEWIVGPGGRAIDMAKPGELTRELGSVLSREGFRRDMGQRARDHCVEHFGEEAVVGQILEYYTRVIGRSAIERSPVAGSTPHAGGCAGTVSVVIPTFNAGQWVAQAVDSVLAQTVLPCEIVVIDDGSTDDTRARLAPYMDRIRYVNQPNLGVAAARNRGIACTTGDFVAFLDADDAWHPRKLELQLNAMRADASLAMLGAAAFDWPADSIPEVSFCRPATVPWRRLAVKNVFTTSSVLVRRQVLERIGVFDPELRGPEDYDLWLRIAEEHRVAVQEIPLVGYRTVSGSLGRRAVSMETGLRRILRKLDDRRAWRGDWLLRRKARAYCGYSCAFLYSAAGDQKSALSRILGSILEYPLPYRSGEVRFLFGRLRMLTMILRRLPGGARAPRTA